MTISLSSILADVAVEFDVPAMGIESRRHSQRVAVPRFVVWWLARELTRLSFGVIARRFYRDHSTVLKGIQSLENKWRVDEDLRIRCEKLLVRLGREAEIFPDLDNVLPGVTVEMFKVICKNSGCKLVVVRDE